LDAARHNPQSADFDGVVGFDKPATDRLGAMLIDVNEAAGERSLGPQPGAVEASSLR
jgi:hypothetical protein